MICVFLKSKSVCRKHFLASASLQRLDISCRQLKFNTEMAKEFVLVAVVNEDLRAFLFKNPWLKDGNFTAF